MSGGVQGSRVINPNDSVEITCGSPIDANDVKYLSVGYDDESMTLVTPSKYKDYAQYGFAGEIALKSSISGNLFLIVISIALLVIVNKFNK